MKGAFLLATLIGLVAPAVARADVYTAQRPADPVVAALTLRADAFWAARGVVGNCAHPQVWQAPSLVDIDGDAWGRGDGASCELWVSQWLVDDLRAAWVFDDVARACQAIAHEDGHAHGLGHARSGLMAGIGPWGQADIEPPGMPWVPGYCISYADDAVTAALKRDHIRVRVSRRITSGIAGEVRKWRLAVGG